LSSLTVFSLYHALKSLNYMFFFFKFSRTVDYDYIVLVQESII